MSGLTPIIFQKNVRMSGLTPIMNLNGILNQFRKFFPDQWLNSLARQTGLVQRSSSRVNDTDMFRFLKRLPNEGELLS
jgi:hypothetical protein